jgi:hypothetical protein
MKFDRIVCNGLATNSAGVQIAASENTASQSAMCGSSSAKVLSASK